MALNASQPPPPNFVLILTDDQDAASIQYMPNVLALAATGTRFDQAYASYALCCPSRATILSGRYAHNHAIYTNILPYGGFEKVRSNGFEADTIAIRLQAAGYRTGIIGKYFNDYMPSDASYVGPGWNVWRVKTGQEDQTSDPAYNYVLGENGTAVQYGAGSANYLDDVLKGKAVSFINSSTGPFFLYVGFHNPHDPATPASRHATMFPGLKAPRPPSFNEADVSDKPAAIKSLPLLTAAQQAQIDAIYRKRIQSLQAIDEAVAAIKAALIAKGVYQNTYIIFTGDHGYHLGSHRLLKGKNTHYEEDIKIPLIITGPNVEPQISSLLAGNVDIAPTIADLGGALFADMDGRSLRPLLEGGSPQWRTYYLLESSTPLKGTGTGSIVSAGLRTVQHRYVEYYYNGEKELYDSIADPYELLNLIPPKPKIGQQPPLPSMAIALGAKLAMMKNCVGQGCRDAEE